MSDLEGILAERAKRTGAKYVNDPAGYARDVLGVKLWDVQVEILESLLKPPYRTLVKAAHSVGKSFTAAVAVCWWYDTRNPGVAITTAPTSDHVRKVLWKEIRLLRAKLGGGGFSGNVAPLLQDGPDHYAEGCTAESGEAFQGRHDRSMLFIFDEAVGIDAIFWETTKTMCKPELGHAWLCIFNPTDTTKQAYLEENLRNDNGEPTWRVITMDAPSHPNIREQLAGRAPPYPSAVTLDQLSEGLTSNSTPVMGAPVSTDIEWPPGSGKWLRPGPVAESRWLGRWPSAGTHGVWSDGLWASVTSSTLTVPANVVPRISCDVARKGDDFTAIHVRVGPVSLHHESWNGWDTMQTVGRLIELAREWAMRYNAHTTGKHILDREIMIVVDDDGVGGGVTDRLREQRYLVCAIGAGTVAKDQLGYPNMRSQLWFDTAQRAREGRLSFAQLPRTVLDRIRQQAMSPTWKVDSSGRRVVEPKDDTKKKIGRSPDDMDAVNLAYHEPGASVPDPALFRSDQPVPRTARGPEQRSEDAQLDDDPGDEQRSAGRRRGFYGR